MTPAVQRDIPDHMDQAQYIKLGKKEDEGDILNDDVCVPRYLLM